jgi:hypothetical protein
MQLDSNDCKKYFELKKIHKYRLTKEIESKYIHLCGNCMVQRHPYNEQQIFAYPKMWFS